MKFTLNSIAEMLWIPDIWGSTASAQDGILCTDEANHQIKEDYIMQHEKAKEIVEKVLGNYGLKEKVELNVEDPAFPYLQVGESFSIELSKADENLYQLTFWVHIPATRHEPEDVSEKTLLQDTDLTQAILRIINEWHGLLFNAAWEYAEMLIEDADDDEVIVDCPICTPEVGKAIEVISNIDLPSNVTLKKWWHFQWFLNLQVKLFGKCIIY